MGAFSFTIAKQQGLLRAGIIATPHGAIETPAFAVVGTKGTVKSLTPEHIRDAGAQVLLANTYHLYLEPGVSTVVSAGGLHRFMNWDGPTITDSGGFQAFSLGAAFGRSVSKIARGDEDLVEEGSQEIPAMATIGEDGVTFRSYIDGSTHVFTPERSIEIQQGIGADIIFAFDECTSPRALYEYQKTAMERTHRWAERSIEAQRKNTAAKRKQALFGIVQGGRYRDLREASARTIAGMAFDGFGIGGSFDREDMFSVVEWVNRILPNEKPRHLLGIGDPLDLLEGIARGCDLFDCVAPTRIARNGTLYTARGKINALNARFKNDFSPVDASCSCYTCARFTRAYIAHLFRAREMLAATLASIHNLFFILALVKNARYAILEGRFAEFRESFVRTYASGREARDGLDAGAA